MALRRSTRMTTVALTIAAVSTAAIIAGVAYTGSAHPADENSPRARDVAAQPLDQQEVGQQQEVGELKNEIGLLPNTLDSTVAAAHSTLSSTAGRADETVRSTLQNAIEPVKVEVAAATKTSLSLTKVSEVRDARDTVKRLCAGGTATLENARLAAENSAAENDAARKNAEANAAVQAKRVADEADAARVAAEENKPVQATHEVADGNLPSNAAEAQPIAAPCPCAQHPCLGRPCPCAPSTPQQAEHEPSAQAESNTGDAERARLTRAQAVSGNRWEAQSANSLRSAIDSTVQTIDQAVSEAQATVDSTVGRATDDSRSTLQTAIVSAKNASPAARASVAPQTEARDLCGALVRAKRLAATHRDELSRAKRSTDDQAVAFDAAKAKQKADAEAASKNANPPVTSPGSPHSSTDATGNDATAICLSGHGAEGAIACVKALAFDVPVAVEWDNRPGSGWWGHTGWTTNPLTANVQLSRSIGIDFGTSPQATSIAMHEAGHASNARCPTVAAEPVFNKRSSRDEPEERFATAYAIAYGAPSRDTAGQSTYGFVSTEEEIAAAKRC